MKAELKDEMLAQAELAKARFERAQEPQAEEAKGSSDVEDCDIVEACEFVEAILKEKGRAKSDGAVAHGIKGKAFGIEGKEFDILGGRPRKVEDSSPEAASAARGTSSLAPRKSEPQCQAVPSPFVVNYYLS